MLKRLLIVFLLALFILPFGAQLTSVSAETNPLTAPITAAFNISGKVTYKRLGRLMQNVQRLVPAKDVMVTVTGFFDKSKKYEVKTDANGEYRLQLPAGTYKVKVKDADRTFFTPPLKVIKIKNTDNQKTVNFQGLLFPGSY